MKSKNEKIGNCEKDLQKFFEKENSVDSPEPLLQPGNKVRIFEIPEAGVIYDHYVLYENIRSEKYPSKKVQIREIHCFDEKQ